MLLTSITANLCAQPGNKSDKTFEVPSNIIFTRRFDVDLSAGNKMTIALSDIADLDRLLNIDSILRVFLKDIEPLKDSLADPVTAKRIDHVTDARGRKKIRLQQHRPKGAGFLVNKGELATLRTEQDTINIIGILVNPPKAKEKISLTNPRYYHFTFHLNDMAQLTTYMNGMLNEKLVTIKTGVNDKWSLVLGSGSRYLKKDRSITADKAKGFTANSTSDFVVLNINLNAQNYKNYFVPSFSIGMKLTLTNRERTFKWEPGLFWEPHYLFAKDSLNKLRTYRNDFLTITYGQGGTRDHDPRKDFAFSAVFSLGYLINRNGDFFDSNTFRLGAGKIQMLKTAIEPSMYFNNFFKGITPGIRITQTF